MPVRRETEKDEQIEFLTKKANALERLVGQVVLLKRKADTLEKIVNQIDRDVAEAVTKYLKEYKPSFPGEKVTFAKFLAILYGEVTKGLRLEWANSHESPLRKEMRASVMQELEDRLATEILDNRLSVVVFVGKHKTIMTTKGPDPRPVYRAACLERDISIEGDSFEDATKKWYHRLRSKLAKGPITRLEFPDEKKLKPFFAAGRLLDEETIGPYKVVVKGYPAYAIEG